MELIKQAKDLHGYEDGFTTFEEDLAFHLKCEDAVFFKTKDTILLARPVRLDKMDLWETYTDFPIKECSAWFVWLAIGKAETLLKLMEGLIPELPYVIRKKKDRFRMVETAKLQTILRK